MNIKTKSPRRLTNVFIHPQTCEVRLIHKPIRDDDDRPDGQILDENFPTRGFRQRHEKGGWQFSNCHITSGVVSEPAPDEIKFGRKVSGE